MVATHRTRIGHLDINTNRWRASKYPRWDADTGHFWADLDHGSKTKVAIFGPLYISYLRFTAIRVID